MYENESTQRIFITGMGHYHPSQIYDNEFFDSLEIGSSADWVRERTGIESRCSILTPAQIQQLSRGDTTFYKLHQAGHIMPMSEMAVYPWELALDRCQSETKPIDLIISGTSVPDYDIPAGASVIGQALGLEGLAMDVNTACSSFVTDLHVSRQMLKNINNNQTAAIFNIERYSAKLDFSDKRSCILFGDGAACAILEKNAGPMIGLEIVDTVAFSSPKSAHMIQIPRTSTFLQNGAAVQKFAIQKTCEVTQKILQRNNLSMGDINYFIGHQANLRMLTSVAQKLEIDESRHLFNVDRYGNQGAAGAPCVLSENWDRFTQGDMIVVAVVGAGLTWGAALFRCFKEAFH